jgi:hypothetical protein
MVLNLGQALPLECSSVQSMNITTKFVTLKPTHALRGVLDTTLCY